MTINSIGLQPLQQSLKIARRFHMLPLPVCARKATMKTSMFLKPVKIHVSLLFQSMRSYLNCTQGHVTAFVDQLRSIFWRKALQILHFPYEALLMSGDGGLIPVRFDKETGKLKRQGRKRLYLWCAYYCGLVPLRGLFLLSLPFVKLVQFKPIGTEISMEDVNMIIFLITAPAFLVAVSVVLNFVMKSDEMILYCNSLLMFEQEFSGEFKVRHLIHVNARTSYNIAIF